MTVLISYLSNVVTSLAGLILFCIGSIGLSGLAVDPSPAVTMLLTPMGYGDKLDNLYYWVMLLLGIWLVMFVYVRPAAFTALTMVLGKSVVLKGWLPLLGLASL